MTDVKMVIVGKTDYDKPVYNIKLLANDGTDLDISGGSSNEPIVSIDGGTP